VTGAPGRAIGGTESDILRGPNPPDLALQDARAVTTAGMERAGADAQNTLAVGGIPRIAEAALTAQ